MRRRSLASFLFFFCLLSSCLTGLSCSSAPARPQAAAPVLMGLPATNLSPKDYAIQKLVAAGISRDLIQKLAEIDLNQKVISYNVLGFLSHADYSVHYSEKAIKKCREFSRKYSKTLKSAQKKYGVSKESIVALLWVETKFGKHMGNYSLPEVYFSLLQADHPEIVKTTLSDLSTREPAIPPGTPPMSETDMQNKVVERSLKKSAWALEQLKNIDQIYQKENASVLNLKSSYAGAFGVPQFIPSTYRDYAISQNQHFPNLFRTQDAIFSVAHFLHEKGWVESKSETKHQSLYEYNHSQDYGDVILKIADRLKKHRV